MQRNKPVLGVCHGAFLLTDLLGGVIGDVGNHSDTDHDIYYFGDARTVNSYHSLAITKLHATATALAVDSDNNCEAWIDGNIAGVVWHPERMSDPWLPDEIKHLTKI